MAERCETCRFFLPLEDYNGLCRRYPPARMSDADFAEEIECDDEAVSGRHPTARASGWCGEWKLAPKPLTLPDPDAIRAAIDEADARNERERRSQLGRLLRATMRLQMLDTTEQTP